MLQNGLELERDALLDVAAKICLAARTAPKGRGVDDLVTQMATGETIIKLAEEMRRLARNYDAPFFERDAGNLEASPVVVLLGTRLTRRGVPSCDYCGYPGCTASIKAGARCAISLGDLGTALGSAVGVAAGHRADNRIMFTIGKAALSLGLLGEDVAVAYGIPLSSSGKSPFFDRG